MNPPVEPSPPWVVDRLRDAGCVFAEDEARLLVAAAATPAELTAMVDERASGVPIEHVLGWAEFCGLRVAVDRGVFVPRRRTEFLVREAIALAPPTPVAVDLCCGSGALGTALAAACEGIELHAVDIDPAAVRCAARNLANVGTVHEGDLYDALPAALRGRVDLLVVNAPYVPTSSIALLPPEARDNEPRVALDGGPDGLEVQRRVAADALGWLAPGGHLLTETSDPQAPELLEVVAGGGLAVRMVRSEEEDATVVIGTAPERR